MPFRIVRGKASCSKAALCEQRAAARQSGPAPPCRGGVQPFASLSLTASPTSLPHHHRRRRYTCNGVAAAETELWAAVDAALAAAGRGYQDVAAICACVAVRDASADLADVLAVLARRLPEGTLKLAQSEAAAALAACTGGVLHGVCVVAGAWGGCGGGQRLLTWAACDRVAARRGCSSTGRSSSS
jgi:hypothetical protein